MNYGWVVLGIITLIEGLGGFGRTSALSPFLKDICHDLDLSIGQISGAYALSQLFAGFILPYAGRAYDRYATSNFLRFYVILFSSAFIGLSMLKFMQLNSFTNFCMFFLGFGCIRTSVHAYTVAGRSTAAIWFDKKRSLATALSCFLLSTIASFMPLMNYKLQENFEWYQVWIVLGVIWSTIIFFICSFVRKPENVSEVKTNKQITSIVRSDFLKKPIFWLIMLAIFSKNFQNTGIALHYIFMSEEFGINPKTIALSFIFISIINTATTFIFGHFFEKISVKQILLLFLSFDCCFLLCLKGASSSILLLGFIIFSGFYWALNQIVAYLVIPKIFGIECIGKIQGYVSAFACLGSASGPFLIGLIKDFASYQLALSICTTCAFILLIFGLLIRYKNA